MTYRSSCGRRCGVELVEHGLVEALDDAAGLAGSGLGSGVVVLDRQIELVFVAVVGSAIFGPAVGEHTLQGMPFSAERDHPVVEQIGGGERGLSVMLWRSRLGAGIDVGLLVDASDAFQGPDIEGVLAAISRAFGDEFAVGLLVGLGLLEGCDLRFGQDQAVLSHLGLERLEPVLHGSQVVAQPDGTNAEG